MPLTRLAHPTAALGARALPALAAIVALYTFGAASADAPAGAETVYLAFAAGIVLLSAAAVAPSPGLEVAAGALLVTVAAWALPEGPARGAVVIAVTAGTLAVAAARWLGRVAQERSLPALGVVGLALGLQALLRGGELLHAGSPLRAVALFVGFPVVGALAVLGIDRAFGHWPALLAGGVAVLVAPGFRPASLAALVALAAAPWLLRSFADRRRALAARIAAGLLLAAPFAWDARAAGVAAAAGTAAALAVVEEPRPAWRPWIALAVAALALLLLALGPGRPVPEVAALASLVVLAVPAIVVTGPERAAAALAALLLAVAAAHGVAVEGALAAPAALAALAVAPARTRESGALSVAQGAWLAAGLGLGSLLGAYPWLRTEPFAELLPLLGLRPTLASAVVAVLAVAALAALGPWSARRHEAPTGRRVRAARVTGWATAGVVAAALVVQIPAAGAPRIDRHPVILDAERPTFSVPGAGVVGAVASLVVDSSLANSAALPAGTPVATVRLRHTDRTETSWVLRAGVETGEWAADRPDLAASELVAPDPWLSWVAEEGGFFGRRYRAVRELARPAPVERAAVELRDDLPEDVTLTLFHLEMRP